MAKTSKPAAPFAPQPPYIKRAHLRNVPPLRDLQVDFKPGLNIIIGKNGSGKTNFMRLLSELADLQAEKYSGEKCELVIGIAAKELKVKFDEQLIGQNDNKQYLLFRPSNGAAPWGGLVNQERTKRY